MAIHANKHSSRKRTGKSGKKSSKFHNRGHFRMTCVEERLYENEKLVALKDLRLDPKKCEIQTYHKGNEGKGNGRVAIHRRGCTGPH